MQPYASTRRTTISESDRMKIANADNCDRLICTSESHLSLDSMRMPSVAAVQKASVDCYKERWRINDVDHRWFLVIVVE